MPTKGINFGSRKQRRSVSQLSLNPHTKATHKWEDELQGLTLANHRIDKAASVEKSRARQKLRSSAEWSSLTPPEQEQREQEMCMQIDLKRAQKKVDARKAWVAKHEDVETDVKGLDDTLEGMGEVEIEYGQEGNEGDVEDSDGSQAEECSEDEEADKLTEEDKRGIFERLHGVWAVQRIEAQQLLDDLENEGRGKEGKETPEDWAFGG